MYLFRLLFGCFIIFYTNTNKYYADNVVVSHDGVETIHGLLGECEYFSGMSKNICRQYVACQGIAQIVISYSVFCDNFKRHK